MKSLKLILGLALGVTGLGSAGIAFASQEKAISAANAYDSRLHIVGSNQFGGWNVAGAVKLDNVGDDNVGGKKNLNITTANTQFKIAYIDNGSIQWGWDSYGSGAMDNKTYTFANDANGNINIKYTGTYNIYLTNNYKVYMSRDLTITFNPNSGTVTPTSKTVNQQYNGASGNVYGDLPTPTRDGYVFDGWYTEASGGTKVTSTTSTYSLQTDTTIYAHWAQKPAVHKYAIEDGVNKGEIEYEYVDKGSTYAVPKGIYRSGYSFDGWYTDSTCQTPYTARAINSDLNLYGKYTSGSWEGSIKIDLRTSGWADSGANYAVYLMNKSTYSTVVSGWSEYKENIAANHYYFEVSYETKFEPTDLTIVRYNSSYTKANWNSNKWPSGQFTQTIDYSISSNIEMFRISDVKEDGKNLAYKGYPKVIGGPSGTWADITYLNSVKSNGSNHAEYYSTNVVLNAGDLFKVQVPPFGNADYYGNYSTHKSIEGNFADGGSANIRTVVGGTYAFYFDSINNSTYITKVEIAQADEWAQAFTSGMQCDGDGFITKDSWGTLSESYSLLMPEAKAIFLAVAEGGKEDGSFVEQAICRYDYIVKKYGTTAKPDFMGRIAAGKIHLSNNIIFPINSANPSAMIAVIVTSSVIALSGATYFLLKKRKQD